MGARLLWLLLTTTPAMLSAADGIHRCLGDNGVSIYTDQPCERLGAVEREPDASIETPGHVASPTEATPPAAVRTDCARRSDTLLFELRRAIEGENVNQLAGLYHWPGTGTRAARGILDRLEGLAARPQASVELVYPMPAPPSSEDTGYPAVDDATAGTREALPEQPPPDDATHEVDPVAVRIEQRLPGDPSPSFAADLQLIRHAECWWFHF